MSIEVTILGCGSSGGVPLVGNIWGPCDPNDARNIRTRVSILVKINNKVFLIDTGPDLRSQMLSSSIKHIDNVLYTHAHADHVHGIDDLRAFCWKRKNNKPLSIYGDEYTINQITSRFEYAFSQKSGPAVPTLEANIIDMGSNIIDNINIEAMRQYHGKGYSVGYRFNNFAYSTDVNKFPEDAFDKLKGLDLWIVQYNISKPSNSPSPFVQTMDWIKELKPKKAILTHMGHWLDYKELKAKCPDNVEPGIDGMVIKV